MVDFNVRGGRKWRKAYNKIRKSKVARYACPSCSKSTVRRKGAGIWGCRSCGAQVAGGAYALSTPVGKLAQRLISDLRKKRRLAAEEIEHIEEEIESVEEEIESEASDITRGV